MINTFSQTAVASYSFYIENYILNNYSGYRNYTSKLYYTPDSQLTTGYHAYSAPFKQWVYDSSVTGAVIMNSITGSLNLERGQSGLKIDYMNGRVLVPAVFGKNHNISGTYAIKDINFYNSNETEESLISNSKFFLNSRFGRTPTSGIEPNAIVTPAIFITSVTHSNKNFDLAGLYKTDIDVSCVVMCDDTNLLEAVLGAFADTKRRSFVQLAPAADPINEFGDVKDSYSGSYSYNAIKNEQGTPGNQLQIDAVSSSRLSDRIRFSSNIYAGIVDTTLVKVRTIN